MRHAVFGAVLALVACLAITAPVQGGTARADGLRVDDVWARATPPGLPNGAVYFELSLDRGSDRLVGVDSPVAERAMMHRTVESGGQSGMSHVDSVAVSADAPVRFAPGGYHVMLMGLDERLVEGDRFSMTLHFAERGAVPVTVEVRAITAQ